jgi:HEPN domain-containing protein
MTQDGLAESYIVKATKRRRVLEVLLEEEAYSDVVREAQELVELALKAMLRKTHAWRTLGKGAVAPCPTTDRVFGRTQNRR